MVGFLSYAARIEYRLLAGAVTLECAVLADGVGALEDPVLPRRQTREDFRFHRLRPGKTQIGFKPGQRIGREARSLFKKPAPLIAPVDVVECKSDEAKPLRALRVDDLALVFLDGGK